MGNVLLAGIWGKEKWVQVLFRRGVVRVQWVSNCLHLRMTTEPLCGHIKSFKQHINPTTLQHGFWRVCWVDGKLLHGCWLKFVLCAGSWLATGYCCWSCCGKRKSSSQLAVKVKVVSCRSKYNHITTLQSSIFNLQSCVIYIFLFKVYSCWL